MTDPLTLTAVDIAIIATPKPTMVQLAVTGLGVRGVEPKLHESCGLL